MRRVDFDAIETQSRRPPGCLRKLFAHLLQPAAVQRQRSVLAGSCGTAEGASAFQPPGSSGRSGSAFPRRAARRFAAGVGELHAYR